MAPKLPSVAKPQNAYGQDISKLLPPLEKRRSSHSSSKLIKGREQRPEWCGPFDSVPSTRVPSEAASRAGSKASSLAPSRARSRASSVASSRPSSRPSSPSASGDPRDSFVQRSDASSHRSSLSNDSSTLTTRSHGASLQHSLGRTASVPSLQLNKMAKNNSVPSLSVPPLNLADVSAKLSASDGAPSKTSKKKQAVEKAQAAQRQLEHACLKNDIEEAKICYLRGASLSEPLSTGEFPLFYATKQKNFAFVEFLKQYGVDMNMRDMHGRTALHIAACNNDDEAICRLVELGAKRKLKDNKGMTALHAAAAAGHARVVELLLDLAADINATDKAGWTAVSHAEFHNHFELADRLVELGASDPLGMRNKTPKTMAF